MSVGLRGSACSEGFLRRLACALGRGQAGVTFGAETLDLSVEFGSGVGGGLRRLKRAGLEGTVTEGAMEEDRQLASEFESGHCGCMVALVAVSSLVSSPAQIMK